MEDRDDSPRNDALDAVGTTLLTHGTYADLDDTLSEEDRGAS